ncbi:hypothetical protein Aph01nite_78210 [Acrocarpospora phusangensis]|uniref:Uncharacterized protein n=1 Tax=Acrocarpospora phusangensis TaxID=1070424 RepID=A0A919QKM4_9ACTN|nr:hypothetical protein Aph01nite_78210 [Acrocarpospora phusangensis]
MEESAEIQYLLDELCVELGFCLPVSEQRRLLVAPLLSVDAFTDATMRAEGLDPLLNKSLRRQVRDKVQRRLPAAEDEPWSRPTG